MPSSTEASRYAMNPRSPLAGDRVVLIRRGHRVTGRINAIHRTPAATEYIVRTDPTDGGMGEVVNVRVRTREASS